MSPRLVLTLGLHGSASTWTYNVARELLTAALGADAVAACFANTLDELLAEPRALGRVVLCKTHGFPRLDALAHLTAARVVATVRDPRDAALSLIDRFGMAPDAAARAIAQDCRYVAWAQDAGHPVLRYEDRFFESAEAARRLAVHLGVTVGAADLAHIAAAWRTDAVRAFAATVGELPAERVVRQGSVFLFDRVTQIHRTHIGDARSGKWRERFASVHRAELAHTFAPFLARFGYPLE